MKKLLSLLQLLIFISLVSTAQADLEVGVKADIGIKPDSKQPAVATKTPTPVKKKIRKKRRVRHVATQVVVSTPTATVVVSPTATPTVLVTATPSPIITPVVKKVVIAQKKFSPADTHFQVGMNFVSASAISPGTLPPGFEFVGTSALEAEFVFKEKLRQFALEEDINLSGQTIGMETYGSSLGTIGLHKNFALIGEIYPLDTIENMPIFPFIGIGAEADSITGSYSMGGYPFVSTLADWTPVYVIGSDFILADGLLVSLFYEFRSVAVTTNLPGVGDLQFTEVGNFGSSLRLAF